MTSLEANKIIQKNEYYLSELEYWKSEEASKKHNCHVIHTEVKSYNNLLTINNKKLDDAKRKLAIDKLDAKLREKGLI